MHSGQNFTRKIVQKKLGEKLVKMLGFCQNWNFRPIFLMYFNCVIVYCVLPFCTHRYCRWSCCCCCSHSGRKECRLNTLLCSLCFTYYNNAWMFIHPCWTSRCPDWQCMLGTILPWTWHWSGWCNATGESGWRWLLLYIFPRLVFILHVGKTWDEILFNFELDGVLIIT